MRKLIIIASLALLAPVGTAQVAQARGCVKGAVVGGVVGHVAGHHALLGAAAGCAVGHHQANKHMKQQRQVDRRDQGSQR
jgi:uncharacterized protein YcfJ